jgi:glycosyltransferase involved in cell wall biosynthesis
MIECAGDQTGRKPRILYVSPCAPRALGAGAEKRSFVAAAALASFGDVFFLCAPSGETSQPLQPASFESNLFVKVLSDHDLVKAAPGIWDSFFSPSFGAKLLHRAWITAGSVLPTTRRQTDAIVDLIKKHCGNESFDLVFIFQAHAAVFAMQAARILVSRTGRVVVDWDAAERPAAAAQYRAQTAKNTVLGNLARILNDTKLARYERYLLNTADVTVCASDYDVDYFLSRKPRGAVRTIPNCITVPKEILPARAKAAAPSFLFVGLINYWPNRSGLQGFVREVWPRLRKRFPGAEFRIVGRGLTDDIAAWNGQDGIQVIGAVDDLRPYYADCDVVIVPMRFSVGSSIKILESLAYCRPTVAFEASAKRHHLRNDEHMCIVSDDNDFFEKAVWIVENPKPAAAMAQRGYDLVAEYYSSTRIHGLIRNLASESPA